MTLEKFIEFVKSLTLFSATTESSDKIIFTYREVEIELIKSDISLKITELTSFSKNETEIFNDKHYEILTRDTSRIYFGRDSNQQIHDQVNGLTYCHGRASDHFLLYVIDKIMSEENIRANRFFDLNRFLRFKSLKREEPVQQELFPIPVLEFLKESISRFDTITIRSDKSLQKHSFENYCYSYIFSLSFNMSYIIYPIRYFDEFFSPLKIGRIRRNTFDSIEPPKRTYIHDIILHYQKGLSSESMDHQFLSFFHILEHFFEKIYNEDLLEKVRSEITKPDFSYKKKGDIENLIKIIQSKTKIQREEFQINELEALELTIKKYIPDLSEIKSDLGEIDGTLIDYYKRVEVPFSKGNKVDFELDPDAIYKALSKRIYYTRNSIVHSKETEKQKYTPFKDDKDLIPEIYLMRIITERVIINNSKEI